MDHFAAQCGFCTPGMLVAARALLNANPTPSREDVVEAISGNLCRCTGYEPIIEAILDVAATEAGRAA
jgi:carbon-monoxide dehydrogenase small subunit